MIDNKKLKKIIDKIYIKQQREIKKVYSELSLLIGEELKGKEEGNYTEQDLRDLKKTIKNELKNNNKEMKNIIKNNIELITLNTIKRDKEFYKEIDKKYGTNLSDKHKIDEAKIVNKVFNQINKGELYKDNKTLSERIWGNDKKVLADINRIINEGIKNKRNPIDIAKDLEKYVNPKVYNDVDLYKMYPGISGKVEANALRLARTSVTHAHQIATSESVKRNPILTHVQYNASNSSRTCEMCADRDQQIYKYDDFPLDHPNGKCFMTAYIPDNIDDLIVEYIQNNILD